MATPQQWFRVIIEVNHEAGALMSGINRLGLGIGTACVGAVLGVPATFLLIVGLTIEWKLFTDPGWPFWQA